MLHSRATLPFEEELKLIITREKKQGNHLQERKLE
jgi:hypothetical protein